MADSAGGQAVRRAYDSFKEGKDMDREGLLSVMAESFTWEVDNPTSAQEAGVFYVQPRRGHAEVLKFFDELDEGMRLDRMPITHIWPCGDTVFVEVEPEGVILKTGKKFWGRELHQWTVGADGKLTAFRHWLDTARHIEANNPGDGGKA